MDPRTWTTRTDYPDLDFHASFASFVEQRNEQLTVLSAWQPDRCSREALVTGAGTPFVRTVSSYARWLAGHERTHVKQIERIIRAATK